MGAATGVVTVLTSRKSFGWQDQCVDPPANPPPGSFCEATAPSPDTDAFSIPLPIPDQATPTTLSPAPTQFANVNDHEAARDPHQRWDELWVPFLDTRLTYEMHVAPTMHTFHPRLGSTPVWTYNDSLPGPTFIANYGVPSIVRFHNELDVNFVGPGHNTHTTHLHNAHTASESDGFAADFWGPGFYKDHLYANILAGYDEFPNTKGDPLEALHTLWYHDHRHSFTAANNYRGLNGMYFLFDQFDTGDENDKIHPNALRLPSGYGVYDIPVILTDKKFCPDQSGMLAFNPTSGGVPAAGDRDPTIFQGAKAQVPRPFSEYRPGPRFYLPAD